MDHRISINLRSSNGIIYTGGDQTKKHVCHTFIFRPSSTTILQQDDAIVKGEEHVDIWGLLLMSFSRAIVRFRNGCWKKPDVKLL